MSPVVLRVKVYIDRTLDLYVEKTLSLGSTVLDLKEQIALDDFTGETRAADLMLSMAGAGPLEDHQLLTEAMVDMNLEQSKAHAEADLIEPMTRIPEREASRSPPRGRDRQSTRPLRIWAVSDVHADMAENLAWVESFRTTTEEFANDCLIVAGDVSDRMDVLRKALTSFKSAFRYVFFVPGNHDLWCRNKSFTGDSLDKYRAVNDLCRELGVLLGPEELPSSLPHGKPILVVPVLSWHHKDFDTEPPLDTLWSGIIEVERFLKDFHVCQWPAHLSDRTSSVAEHFDKENEALWAGSVVEHGLLMNGARERYAAVISFSHFLPRIELCPEKRFLTMPTLLQGVGSRFLGDRVSRLRPDVHVFGHTHFGWDAVHDGVRYVQAPLCYTSERKQRALTVALDDWKPKPDAAAQRPFLVWSDVAGGGSAAGLAPRRNGAAWSSFYAHYGRRPDVTRMMPSYVATNLAWDGPGEPPMGWAGQAPASAFAEDPDLITPMIAMNKEATRDQKKEANTIKNLGGAFQPIGADDLDSLLKGGQKVWLVDLRSAPDFEAGHIAFAIHLPAHCVLRLSLMMPRSRRLGILERINEADALIVAYGGGEDTSRVLRQLCRMAASRTTKFRYLAHNLDDCRESGLSIVRGSSDGLPPAEEPLGGYRWEVVGGEDLGGIIVRTGEELSSPKAERRLGTASVVCQLCLVGDRLRYELISGMGPQTGWVSVRLNHKVLLEWA